MSDQEWERWKTDNPMLLDLVRADILADLSSRAPFVGSFARPRKDAAATSIGASPWTTPTSKCVSWRTTWRGSARR